MRCRCQLSFAACFVLLSSLCCLYLVVLIFFHESVSTQSLFAVLRQTRREGGSCSDDEECTAQKNAQCFHGECVCIPGFFYSHSAKACLQNCSGTDLGNSFQRYPESYLLAPILDIVSGVTDTECINFCSANTQCLGFNYYQRKRDTVEYYCYMVNHTAETLPQGSFVYNFTACDYYQRHCA